MEGANPILYLLTLTTLISSLLHPCISSKTTVVTDMLTVEKAPTLQIKDSLVFEHIKDLYLFHSRRAFDHCMFDQATLVYEAESNFTNFTWQPLRAGHYYFSTKDVSRPKCEEGEKVPVRVIRMRLSPTPAPISGGDLPAFPSPGWVSSTSSSPSFSPEGSPLKPGEGLPAASPASGGGIPFISSNPAVPIPTGETDTATIRPLPTPGNEMQQMVGDGSSHDRINIVVVVVSFMMCAAFGLWL